MLVRHSHYNTAASLLFRASISTPNIIGRVYQASHTLLAFHATSPALAARQKRYQKHFFFPRKTYLHQNNCEIFRCHCPTPVPLSTGSPPHSCNQEWRGLTGKNYITHGHKLYVHPWRLTASRIERHSPCKTYYYSI